MGGASYAPENLYAKTLPQNSETGTISFLVYKVEKPLYGHFSFFSLSGGKPRRRPVILRRKLPCIRRFASSQIIMGEASHAPENLYAKTLPQSSETGITSFEDL